MRSNAVYTPSAGWSEVDVRAPKDRPSRKDGGGHLPGHRVRDPAASRGGRPARPIHRPRFGEGLGSRRSCRPRRSRRRRPSHSQLPRIGSISLTAIDSLSGAADSRHYAASALASTSLQATHHPCGWIVDLRGDVGGDMYPMLFSVGPILGSGRLIGFSRKDEPVWVTYRNNSLSGAGDNGHSPVEIADFTPTPAVAVLTGPETLSAGEAVAIAFRGRPQTRSFGEGLEERRTATARTDSPTGPGSAFPATGTSIAHGHVYRHAITPGVSVLPDWGERPVEVATTWLESTPACRPSPDSGPGDSGRARPGTARATGARATT